MELIRQPLRLSALLTKATDEARNRAKIKFNLTDDDLPYFSTLHAFGKRQLGMTHSEVMDGTGLQNICK